MKKLFLTALLTLIASSAHAITFSPQNITIERGSIKYVYTGKTFFFGYFVIIESSQPGKFYQLTNDLAAWRKNHSSVKDGSPLSLVGNVVLDSGYVGGWQNNGQYDIVTSPLTNLTLAEQNSAISTINLLSECKIFRSGKNYTDYKCN